MIWTKKENTKKLTPEQEQRIKDIIKEVYKIEKLLKVCPDGTKEKGDLVLSIIKLKEEQYKITSTMSDRLALRTLKILYKSGLGYNRWKK
jgi:hypothetical protein